MSDSAGLVVQADADSSLRSGDVPELVTGTLRHNENLWRFSERMTGDPRNWQHIAKFNGIDDAMLVDPGQSLLIPTTIVARGH